MPATATAIDTETCLLRPGQMAPPLVCLTEHTVGQAPAIYDRSEARTRLCGALACDNIIVGHNIAYDMAVICSEYPDLVPAVFAAYAADRVTDTGVRQKLLDLAGGVYRGRMSRGVWVKHEYSLEALTRRIAGYSISKEGFRLFYSFFREVPLSGWTDAARALQARGAAFAAGGRDEGLEEMQAILRDPERFAAELAGMIAADPSRVSSYPVDDAVATLAVYQKQEAHARYLPDQYRQTRAAFWLHLSSAWGLRTDGEGVERLRDLTQKAYDAILQDLVDAGLVRPNGSRDTKAAKRLMIDVCKRDALPLRRTEAHASDAESKCKGADGKPLPAGHEDCVEHVCLDVDACGETGDELLEDYSELSTLKKVLTNDVEALLKGTHLPVHTRYGFAATGRTTSSGPNIQNLRRLAGIREAFVPRPGKVFAQADFPALELYTLAQCCLKWLGQSKLADALNGGLDPHLAMAAQIVGTSYTEAKTLHDAGDVELDDIRQLAKLGNFGFPGGMGVPKLTLSIKKQLGQMNPALLTRLHAKGFLAPDRMRWLKEQWFATWPEMPHYFARVNALFEDNETASVETLFTKRVRGGATYCAACNNGFQALGSDCAKSAGWILSRSLYTDRASALYNSRVVAFVHDEFIVETNDGPGAHDAALELARLMCEGANLYLPDVPIPVSKLKPLLMRRWSKKARPVRDIRGRLVPWEAA